MAACAALTVTLALTPATQAQIVTSSWSSAVSGSWDDGSKWDKGSPLAGTNAYLGGNGSYAVDFTNPVNYAIGALIITNSGVSGVTTLDLNTNGFTFNGAKWGNAAVVLNAGAVVTNKGIVSDGFNQTLTINPPASSFKCNTSAVS